MSHTPRWLLALTLIAGFSLAAYAMTGTPPPPDAHCVEVPELGVYVCGTTTTSSTTTTTVDTTTTTRATTTTSSTTTTTSPPSELVIPPTQPYPGGLKAGGGFKFEIACIEGAGVDCDRNAQGGLAIASFDYFGHGMPYLYPEAVEGGHNHAWWVDGDREGYRCAYGFMYDQHPNPPGTTINRPGELIARATIVRPFGSGYGKINDTYMNEAERYYSGEPTPWFGGPEKEIPDEDCQATALDVFDYESYVPHGPDQIRVGLFRADGAIGDIRDFTQVDVRVPGHFEFIGLEDGRLTIGFILGASGKVSHVFYYDVLGSGRIAVEVNGATIGE